MNEQNKPNLDTVDYNFEPENTVINKVMNVLQDDSDDKEYQEPFMNIKELPQDTMQILLEQATKIIKSKHYN